MSISNFVKKSLLFLWLPLMTFTAIAQAQVNLTKISPPSGQANVSNIYITGSGFPATVTAANITVTLTTGGGPAPVTTTALSVTTVSGSIKRVMFKLSNAVTSPTQWQVSIADPTDGIAPTNSLSFTENPPAAITGLSPNSGTQGTSVPVAITGNFTTFIQGLTTANFLDGSGLTVTNLVITDGTHATATIVIPPGATATTDTLTVATGAQSETSPFTVNAAVQNFSVSGTITRLDPGGLAGATVTLSPGGQTATTDANGNYSFPSVASGSYTATPSYTFPAGSNAADRAVFFPSSLPLNVTQNLSGENFNAQLSYTVSGTVTYPANALFSTGVATSLETYIRLQNPNCSSCATNGTSVLLSTNPNATASKAFTLHTYAGTFNAAAWADTFGYATPNIGDPAGSTSITVSNADVTGVTIALADPTPVTDPGTLPVPTLTVSNINNGVMIVYKPIMVNGVEQASSYDLNWSNLSASDCAAASTPPGSATSSGFNVQVGGNPLPENSGRVIILDGNAASNPFNSPTNLGGVGTTYFFCMRGNNIAGTPFATFANASSKLTTGPSTGIATTVPVTIPSGVTLGTSTSPTPLYSGCYDAVHSLFYAVSDEAPIIGTKSYNALIPTGTVCHIFSLLDLDKDGAGTPMSAFASPFSTSGDIFNLSRDFTTHTITATGSIPVDLTPFKGDTKFVLTTQHTMDQSNSESFGVNFDVSSLQSIPTAVELQSPSPNLNSLLDFADCTNCGQGEFNQTLSTNNVVPSGSYTVNVTKEVVPVPAPVSKTATVSGVNSGFSTSLNASGGGTPTIMWNYPANPANYTYELRVFDANGNLLWQVPSLPSGFNSTAITAGLGFPSTVTSPITYGTDPTGNTSNVPTLSPLTSGTYVLSFTSIDSNGNRATQKANYTF